MKQDLLQRMELEPCILMTGKSYTHLSQDVIDYRWNMAVTTSCELKFSVAFKNDGRMVQDVFDASDMQANMLNRRNLHVVKLCGEKELEAEKYFWSKLKQQESIRALCYDTSKESKENICHPPGRQQGTGTRQCEFYGGAGRICGNHGRVRFRKDYIAEYYGIPG